MGWIIVIVAVIALIVFFVRRKWDRDYEANKANQFTLDQNGDLRCKCGSRSYRTTKGQNGETIFECDACGRQWIRY